MTYDWNDDWVYIPDTDNGPPDDPMVWMALFILLMGVTLIARLIAR